MRLTYDRLHKMKSGQTVWRVLVRTVNGTSKVFVERRFFCGKKKAMTMGGSLFWYFTYRAEPTENLFQNHTVHFVNDAMGTACFTSARQAERFRLEVLAGQHPEVIKRAQEFENLFKKQDQLVEHQRETEYYQSNPEFTKKLLPNQGYSFRKNYL